MTVRADGGRGVSPVVGTLILLVLTICLAGIVVAMLGVASTDSLERTPHPPVAFDLTVDATDEGTIELEHRAGEAVDVRDLTVFVTVEGEPLAEQPPVPFFSEDGFDGGPEGPFNERADPHWTVGERASVSLAGTNDPTIGAGDTIVVTLTLEGQTIARLETAARGG
ncbi:hypothetical protein GCM10025298_09710 [Natronobiforma cellulositropha]